MENTPRYPDVQVALSGRDGNAFAIIGRVSKALRRAGVSEREINEYMTTAMEGNYDHLLRTTMEWVEVS